MTEPLRSHPTAAIAKSEVAPSANPPADLVDPSEELPRLRTGEPRHLRVVEPRSRWRIPTARTLFVGGASIAIAVSFGLVYLHVVMAQRQFQLDDLNAKVSQEQALYQQLRVKVAELDSPQEIISAAEGEFGMRQPSSVTYLSPPAGSAGSSSGLGSQPKPGPGDVIPAPQGDANWPTIKADVAGSP